MSRLLKWPLGLLIAVLVASSPRAADAPPQIAITFDDLPVHASLPPGVTRVDVVNGIIAALKAHHTPPIYGFVNAHWIAEDPANAEVLRLWRVAGFPLGNHTYTHMDANKNPVEAFEQDILADEPTLRTYMGNEDWHWLRLPYLNPGDTAEKRKQITDFLAAQKYRIALVTLSFDDYAYNDPYARCMAKGDKDAVDWMKASYLDRASVDLVEGSRMSESLYARNIKHVLLMHIGAFDAVMLPQLLDLYESRGVEFISLPDAQSDPAYGDSGLPQFDWGGSMLAEQMVARNVPIPASANTSDTLKKLDTLCR